MLITLSRHKTFNVFTCTLLFILPFFWFITKDGTSLYLAHQESSWHVINWFCKYPTPLQNIIQMPSFHASYKSPGVLFGNCHTSVKMCGCHKNKQMRLIKNDLTIYNKLCSQLGLLWQLTTTVYFTVWHTYFPRVLMGTPMATPMVTPMGTPMGVVSMMKSRSTLSWGSTTLPQMSVYSFHLVQRTPASSPGDVQNCVWNICRQVTDYCFGSLVDGYLSRIWDRKRWRAFV